MEPRAVVEGGDDGGPGLPRGRGERPGSPGRSRAAVVAAAAVVLVLLGVLVVGALRATGMVGWGLSRLASRVLAALPPGTPAAVRSALADEFACVIAAARANLVPERRLGAFARGCTDALADGVVTPDELERIDAIARQVCAESRRAAPSGEPR